MRGKTDNQGSLLCLVDLGQRIPKQHPLRRIREVVEAVLRRLDPLFDEMYSSVGRSSVPPEQLLKGLLLMALYSIRSERQLCEQLQYNLLYRWFLGMDMVQDAFDASTFSKNRERLLEHEVSRRFMSEVVWTLRQRSLISDEHFSVDGSLIESWASMKSFRPKDSDDDDTNGWSDFRGSKRSNDTHESKTDPDARLARRGKGQGAKLCLAAHALMENANGFIVDVRITREHGRAERETAIEMVHERLPGRSRLTLAADKGYDCKAFVLDCRTANVTPHVAQKKRYSAIDGRTTRHLGYRKSQKRRRRIEQLFGWLKAPGRLRKTRYRGVERNQLATDFYVSAYNLLRLAKVELAQV